MAFCLLPVVAGVALTLGWGPVLAPWQALTPAELLPPIVLTALSYCLRGARIHDYFRPRPQGRFPAVLRLSVLHTTAKTPVANAGGELVFPWLMGRYFFGHGFLSATTSLVWIRLLDLHFLGLMGICILSLRYPTWLWSLVALRWLLLLPPIMGLLGRRRPTVGAGSERRSA